MTSQLIASFDLLVSYYQIAISDTTLERPCNKWRPAHSKQGFVWRPRSVSFGTLDALLTHIEVWIKSEITLRATTQRAIRVPFSVLADSKLEVAVVGDQRSIDVPPGEYALTFEHGTTGTGDDEMWCVFTFVPDHHPKPAVLIADPAISPVEPLLTDADPE